MTVELQRVEQDQQSAAAGVDHAGVTQYVKLLGGLLQRDHRGVTGGDDRPGQPLPGVRGLLDGVTGGLEHRDDRPRDLSAAHRGDDQINPAMQCRAEQRGVDVVSAPPASAAARAVTSAIPRRIWDRITPELPRAPLQRARREGSCQP